MESGLNLVESCLTPSSADPIYPVPIVCACTKTQANLGAILREFPEVLAHMSLRLRIYDEPGTSSDSVLRMYNNARISSKVLAARAPGLHKRKKSGTSKMLGCTCTNIQESPIFLRCPCRKIFGQNFYQTYARTRVGCGFFLLPFFPKHRK